MKSLWGKFIGWALKKEVAQIQARYEAAYWNLNRSYLPGFIQSAHEDINALSRQEILRRVRYFEKNSNVLSKVLTILDVNVVGAGIVPTPATSNVTWNKSALEWWTEWSQGADVTGMRTIPQCQSIVFRGQNVDGDHGLELTETPSGRPAVALVEGHRINSLGYDSEFIDAQGFRVVDGVLVDKRTGRPMAYLVSDEFDKSSVRPIPNSRFVHFLRQRRAGQYRGITIFHAAIVDLHDSDDLQKFEMLAAKVASSRAEYIKTAQGSITPSEPMIGRSLQLAPATGNSADREKYYAQAFGGESKVLFPGDDVTQARSDRPSAAISGFWDRLDNKIVQGAGVSYAALVDYRGNWGGATLRAAVQSDNRLYELNTIEQAIGWQKVWEYAIGWAIQHGELAPNVEYRKVRWHPPRRATVDIGHESQAMLAELQAGAKTYQDVYGELGEDWKDRLAQRAEEEAYIDQLAKEKKIPREWIASFAQERMNRLAHENASDGLKKAA